MIVGGLMRPPTRSGGGPAEDLPCAAGEPSRTREARSIEFRLASSRKRVRISTLRRPALPGETMIRLSAASTKTDEAGNEQGAASCGGTSCPI